MQLVHDGDDIYVEYGPGPRAFSMRWEGRPPTPDFEWHEGGMVVPPHDQWLDQLDLAAEGINALVSRELLDNNGSSVSSHLEAVKTMIRAHAGALQACFLLHECQVCQLSMQTGRRSA